MQNEFVATPTLGAFMLSKAKIRLIFGPVGSGKSVGCSHELFRWATQDQAPNAEGVRKTRFVIVRNTADQLRSTTMKTVFDWFPPGVACKWKATDRTMVFDFMMDDGTRVYSEWMFLALDTPDDVRKALSLEATGLWGNESRELHPDVVDGLLMRVGRYPSMKDGGATRSGAIFDSNMPVVGSWWADKATNPPKSWEVFIQPPAILPYDVYKEKHDSVPADQVAVDADGDRWVVNPEADNVDNLPRDYYVTATEGKPKRTLKMYLLCEFAESLDGQPVFEAFRRPIHVVEGLQPIPMVPLVIGMDFGLTPAAVVTQMDPRGRLRVLDELTSTNMGLHRFLTERLVPLMASRYPGYRVVIVGDPAGVSRSQVDERTVFDELAAFGFVAEPAVTNDIAARLSAVDKLLTRMVDGLPGLMVDPGCTDVVMAFQGGYRFRVSKHGVRASKPEKNEYSHIMDALQYACLYAESGGVAAMPHGRQRREVRVVPMRAWT